MILTVESPEGSLVLLEAWTPPPPTGGGPGPASSIIDPLCGETPEGGARAGCRWGWELSCCPLGLEDRTPRTLTTFGPITKTAWTEPGGRKKGCHAGQCGISFDLGLDLSWFLPLEQDFAG